MKNNTITNQKTNPMLDLFPISEFDKRAIDDFIESHNKNAHKGYKCIYSYSFTPMPLGFFGACKCEFCGEEQPFMSLLER